MINQLDALELRISQLVEKKIIIVEAELSLIFKICGFCAVISAFSFIFIAMLLAKMHSCLN